jgi:hypothetical protein
MIAMALDTMIPRTVNVNLFSSVFFFMMSLPSTTTTAAAAASDRDEIGSDQHNDARECHCPAREHSRAICSESYHCHFVASDRRVM